MAEVDNSTWDAGRAMRECETAADYGKICAGKKAGDPSLRASWALPHHYLSKAPVPNAAGVRNALARLPQTQGLTNAGQARSHLEAHMSQINPDYQAALATDGKLIARAPIEEWEVRHTGRADEGLTVRGYAAVYDVLSHDLGGFRTKIDSHALDEVLAAEPDVHFVWDHDTRYVGARTTNGTLDLSSDDHGLFIEARVGNYSWAKDLRVGLERGDLDQGSVAIGIAEDHWEIDDSDEIIRTVMKADGLYDVTVTAQGAFPQTSLAAAFSLVRAAVAEGRLPEEVGARFVARDEGEPPAKPAGESAAYRRAQELRNLYAVHRDEIAAWIERSKAL
jgi:HK97 family phage prohead protease